MIILDAPYASEPLLDWMETSQHPVLANDFTRTLVQKGRALHEVDEAETTHRLEAGERIYTNSENALAWIVDHVNNPTLTEPIRLFKDKAAMREKLADLNPGLFHKTVSRKDLASVDVQALPMPVVLKPSVGFCSMGVYVIEQPQDWVRALEDIALHEADWHARYPESVVGGEEYLIESYLTGTEYALDAYFDEEGAAHILNILRHDFADPEDTSDRLYYTDETIVTTWDERFTDWLNAVNEVVGARAIPVHVELRTDGKTISPIEFNPLRFAGLGGTDVAYFGVGLRTYAAFLENTPVDLRALYGAHPGKVYSMSLLNPSPEADLSKPFDSRGLKQHFTHVLSYHDFDVNVVGSYGFLFLETADDAEGEMERTWLLRNNLMPFVG